MTEAILIGAVLVLSFGLIVFAFRHQKRVADLSEKLSVSEKKLAWAEKGFDALSWLVHDVLRSIMKGDVVARLIHDPQSIYILTATPPRQPLLSYERLSAVTASGGTWKIRVGNNRMKDPFDEFNLELESGDYIIIYQTERCDIEQNLPPYFKMVQNMSRPKGIRYQVYRLEFSHTIMHL